MKTRKTVFVALATIGALSFSPAAFAATAGATGAFDINIPASVELVTNAGNANDTFPEMTVTVDSATGVATGTTSLSWNLSSNSAGGAIVTAYLPNLVTPTNGTALGGDIKVLLADAGGSIVTTPLGAYVAGQALSAMPTTSGAAENIFSTAVAGTGKALMTLNLSAPPADGSGHVTGTITLIGTTQ
jgi:hypothetical protein